MEGKVIQLSIKSKDNNNRGLPKIAVDHIYIKKTGVEGDYNKYRTEVLSGDLDQAILILPLETIKELNNEGWQINLGDIGENITSQGLAYSLFKTGDKYLIGEAVIELTKPCTPCNNLAALPYVGKDKIKLFIRALLNRRGWFAKVLKEGVIYEGDSIKKIM